MKRPCGHLTAIRRMAKELTAIAKANVLFWHNELACNAAEECEGELGVGLQDKDGSRLWWDRVDLSTARFTDYRGNDLMAIQ